MSRLMVSERLIVFSRYPRPGKAKTRLIPALGPEGAAGLQRQMTEHLLRRLRGLESSRPLEIEIRYADTSQRLMAAWLGPGYSYRPQGRGDLGARMAQAFAAAFSEGMERVVLTGTDCPGITTATARTAFSLLDLFDLVLGPASDGGYYMIGLRRPRPQLFQDLPWGTAAVRAETQRIAARLGLRLAALEPLDDVDRPEDLAAWHREAGRPEAPAPLISIVIPTLDEQEHLGASLASARQARRVEVIVVDGGSIDKTRDLALAGGVRLLTTPPGRAGQMNAGAAAASAPVLLFLHGDTRLPAGFEESALKVLETPGTAAGAFRLGIAGTDSALRLVERVANWRARLLQLPYGDQAIFVRAELFRQLGGFPELPIMEDYALVRRLRDRGRVVLAPLAVTTSARRWRRLGIWRTTLINQAVLAGYWLGMRPERLARWYGGSGAKAEVRAKPVRSSISGLNQPGNPRA